MCNVVLPRNNLLSHNYDKFEGRTTPLIYALIILSMPCELPVNSQLVANIIF